MGVEVAGEHVFHDVVFYVPEGFDDPDETLVVVVELWIVTFKH